MIVGSGERGILQYLCMCCWSCPNAYLGCKVLSSHSARNPPGECFANFQPNLGDIWNILYVNKIPLPGRAGGSNASSATLSFGAQLAIYTLPTLPKGCRLAPTSGLSTYSFLTAALHVAFMLRCTAWQTRYCQPNLGNSTGKVHNASQLHGGTFEANSLAISGTSWGRSWIALWDWLNAVCVQKSRV